MVNAFTVDLEDWFCGHNISRAIPPSSWDCCQLRIAFSTRKLLHLLDAMHVRATFFVLGWIAERVPELIREIGAANHEIAVHGYRHRLLTSMTPHEFASDTAKTLSILSGCKVGQKILGFRAPCFTIVRDTMWAIDVLKDLGFVYDSSIFPIGIHPDYGIGDAPLNPFTHPNGLKEFPMSVVEILRHRLPFGGGGYFRLMPYSLTRRCMCLVNAAGRPVIFYIHPWELDPDQPRVDLPRLSQWRHSVGQSRTEGKLACLLRDFEFTSLKEVLTS